MKNKKYLQYNPFTRRFGTFTKQVPPEMGYHIISDGKVDEAISSEFIRSIKERYGERLTKDLRALQIEWGRYYESIKRR